MFSLEIQKNSIFVCLKPLPVVLKIFVQRKKVHEASFFPKRSKKLLVS